MLHTQTLPRPIRFLRLALIALAIIVAALSLRAAFPADASAARCQLNDHYNEYACSGTYDENETKP